MAGACWLYVLATIRRKHGLTLESVRRALETQGKLGVGPHPLIGRAFQADGASFFAEAFGELVNLSKGGQVALAKLLEASLERIDRDDEGQPIRLFPWRSDPAEPKILVIDPAVSFGRPAVAGTGIPVDVLAERWLAAIVLIPAPSRMLCDGAASPRLPDAPEMKIVG